MDNTILLWIIQPSYQQYNLVIENTIGSSTIEHGHLQNNPIMSNTTWLWTTQPGYGQHNLIADNATW